MQRRPLAASVREFIRENGEGIIKFNEVMQSM